MIRPTTTSPEVTGTDRGEGVLNAFTVDVEDYFHVANFEDVVSRKSWDQYPSRVVGNTTRILDLLDRHQVKATFFVLGWVASRHPEIVREIHHRGHEIGSHGYWHRLIYRQSPRQFLADLRRSRKLLEDVTGVRVRAYRAPSFSITRQSLWALDILIEEGIEIDSSIFPIRHDRYGIPGAQPRLHRLETSAGSLWELPPSVVSLFGRNVPVGGGGYFRLYPLALTRRWLRQINASGHPFMFYVHPWELDPDQPRLRGCSPLSRFRHYINLARTESRLHRLLESFCFAPMSSLIPAVQLPLAQECLQRVPSAQPARSTLCPARHG